MILPISWFTCIIIIITIFNANLGNAEINIPQFQTLRSCKFDKIYQLGDSMADTGNIIRELPVGKFSQYSRPPYGQDFHTHQPTGRCSNGLIMIDYIASAAGLPYINPYEDVDANFTHGANFAVSGATALPSHVLEAKGMINPFSNSSLDVQLHWMSKHFRSICHTYKDCAKKFKNALFMVGEIGGNDLNYAFSNDKSIEEIKCMVPKAAIRVIRHYGVVRLVIPGNFPMGCLPCFLTAYSDATRNASDYDEHHCWKEFNKLSVFYNDHLKQTIQELKQEFPDTIIAYGDYYNAFKWLLQRAHYLGFDEHSVLKACCGVGGNYNFDARNMCGAPSATVCADSNARISWDGVHLTQAAYKYMANWLLATILPQLQCSEFSSSAP